MKRYLTSVNGAFGLLTLSACLCSAVSSDRESYAALPDPSLLKERALANMKRSAQALENYSCMVFGQYDELNGDGTVTKHESRRVERFFVNGVKIDHVLTRNGKELSKADGSKEQARVDKEVKKYLDPSEASKRQDHIEKQLDMFLRAQRLLDGRRELRSNRQTVCYRLESDPKFHPKNLEERFAQAVAGRICIDAESGAPAELEIETMRDVKIGGGLLATLHKGFGFHLVEQRQADGTWLTKSIEGSGDARAALFLHPRFRFKEQLEDCHLFSVESGSVEHQLTVDPGHEN